MEVERSLQKGATGGRLSGWRSFNVGAVNSEALNITEQAGVGIQEPWQRGRIS